MLTDEDGVLELIKRTQNSLNNQNQNQFESACEKLGIKLFGITEEVPEKIFSALLNFIDDIEKIKIDIDQLFILFQLNFETFNKDQSLKIFSSLKDLYYKLPNSENCLLCLILMVDLFQDKRTLETLIELSNIRTNFLREKVSYGILYFIEEKDQIQLRTAANEVLKRMCSDSDENIRREAQTYSNALSLSDLKTN